MLRDAVGVIRIKHSDSLEKTVIKIRDFFFFFPAVLPQAVIVHLMEHSWFNDRALPQRGAKIPWFIYLLFSL